MENTCNLLDGYLTVEQLADELGKTPKTIERWHRLGEGPPRVRIGRTPLYNRQAVREWLATRTEGNAA